MSNSLVSKSLYRLLLYAGLMLVCLPFLFPFLWMVTSSFKGINEIFATPPTLIPQTLHWENYREAFEYQPFARHYANSLYIAFTVTSGTMFIASLSGYAFARIRFKGSSILFLILLSTLMMPSQVTIVPNFTLMKELNLTNTHAPLILLPLTGANAVSATFLMRQYFLSLPQELEEAAMLDGLSYWGIYRRIALPIARPALAAVAIISFLFSWNSYLEPLVFITDQELFTLPLSLRSYIDVYGAPLWNLQLAATTMSLIPILLVYLVAQRQVINSFAFSGLKG